MAKKKKRPILTNDPVPHIDGDFIIAAFDLSLARPGFALMKYHADTRKVEILKKDIVSNKTLLSKKKRGQIINEIAKLFTEYISPLSVKLAVRERAFVRFTFETQALFSVQGALDMILWNRKEQAFQEYSPMEVKKLVTGSGKATKEEVAEAVDAYCEHSAWRSDDESDAVAVGLTWFIEHGYIETIPLEKYRKHFEEWKAEEERVKEQEAEKEKAKKKAG